MTETVKSYDPSRFRTNGPFYTRYRLVVQAAAKPGAAVMDLGRGPGLLEIPFARQGLNVTGIWTPADRVL